MEELREWLRNAEDEEIFRIAGSWARAMVWYRERGWHPHTRQLQAALLATADEAVARGWKPARPEGF